METSAYFDDWIRLNDEVNRRKRNRPYGGSEIASYDKTTQKMKTTMIMNWNKMTPRQQKEIAERFFEN